MEHYFLCPVCGKKLILPRCGACGYQIPVANSIYYFCHDASMKLDGEKQYIGYDRIGENFEPEVTDSDGSHTERYGVYAACGDLIAKKYGTEISVLDLGAGLGSASIPLAKNGIYTIAADISTVMLTTAARRANGRFDNLILARMNAYELMLPDESVDIVVENAMLHLVNEPKCIIKEIVRVLKPNGKLIRYSSPGLPLNAEEAAQNRYCNRVLADINDCYYRFLAEHHDRSAEFRVDDGHALSQHFAHPYHVVADGFAEIFTDKLKYRLHRLKTGAHSDLQQTSEELLRAAWAHTDLYAKQKYGENYAEIKGFSKYGAALAVYEVIKSI